ncbi:hypothetical protein [Blastopirellula marina]|uniref:Uncharacterized protein n=1 Tax=Blastopirellula marina TaxID=124 RepID=A0A2S8FCR1_9BACT|nr:hypothetical protein [Blastopirellula marina]PQO29912.1 hypothetical protein C5Y98_21860 [Blastopirellula marina]PTL42380.1 hypothetical protein C5Y97_21870 [Blastopirellula marina]
MALVRMAGSFFAYLCVATVLAQIICVAMFANSGTFTKDKLYSLMALVYGIDEDAIREEAQNKDQPEVDREEPDMQQIIDERAERHLALDFRIQALDTGIENLRNMQSRLMEERRRYDQLKNGFDQRLKALEDGVLDDAILEVQRTLEALDPRQAKEQILMMLERDDKAMIDVVKIIKAMSTDKRKKIMGEFRTEDEQEKLADILDEIRRGVPDTEILGDARDKLKQFEPEAK